MMDTEKKRDMYGWMNRGREIEIEIGKWVVK